MLYLCTAATESSIAASREREIICKHLERTEDKRAEWLLHTFTKITFLIDNNCTNTCTHAFWKQHSSCILSYKYSDLPFLKLSEEVWRSLMAYGVISLAPGTDGTLTPSFKITTLRSTKVSLWLYNELNTPVPHLNVELFSSSVTHSVALFFIFLFDYLLVFSWWAPYPWLAGASLWRFRLFKIVPMCRW